MVEDVGAPAGADARGAVDENERQNGEEMHRLDGNALFLLGGEKCVILAAEKETRHRRETGVDVPRGGAVFAAEETRAELAVGLEEIEVVCADEILRHRHNRLVERLFAVVIEFGFADESDWERTKGVTPTAGPP